jgi:uncharacterized membrane protein
MKTKVFIFLVAFFALFQCVHAATIHGSIYNPSYSLVKDAKIEINTTPKQSQIAKDGLFFFYAPPGSYEIITEKTYQGKVVYRSNKTIEIEKDGEYTIDIVTDVVPGVELPPEPKMSFLGMLYSKLGYLTYVILFSMVLIIVVLSAFLIHVVRQRKSPDTKSRSTIVEIPDLLNKVEASYVPSSINIDPIGSSDEKEPTDTEEHPEQVAVSEISSDLDVVLNIIKEEGGRATQRDIRKRLPLSEAKVSLMISELEAKGKVEKIKKGRGNIVVLKN